MLLFPAIDIKNGECVRLRQGQADAVTVFSKDPASMAQHWIDLGASWLHVIDLDGAFSGTPVNAVLINTICKTCAQKGVRVQLGGGIRTLDIAKAYVEAGVTRLIIGTVALEEPDLFKELCRQLPGQIGVSLDAHDGRLKTKGWVDDAGLTALDVLPRLEEQGAAFIIYTDICRDGMQSGVNMEALEQLLANTRLPVIAAGGVTTLKDIKNLAPLASKGLQGAITGRAIYEGTLDVKEALDWLATLERPSGDTA